MMQTAPDLESQDDELSSSWRSSRLFGFTLVSDFPFANRLATDAGVPDLAFTRVHQRPLLSNRAQLTLAYTSPHRTDDGETILRLYRFGDCDLLRFTHVADYCVWPRRIVCHLLDPTYDYMVEIRLLGAVLSFWLERQGIPALHASAIVVDDRAVAFLSTNKGGKSSLVATLMLAGHQLLTDDILAVENLQGEFVGRPGYPTMRFWPDEAKHFLGGYEELELVHPDLDKRRTPVGCDGFGKFCEAPQPLACIYLPERRGSQENGTEIDITPVSRRDALLELIRHSFAASMLEAVGVQPQRLEFVAQMVHQVPIRRLVYPSGFEHLPRVRDALLEDLTTIVYTDEPEGR